MINAVKIENKKSTQFIAHRGLSGIELENTMPAFTAAGNHSYYGIETDVHVTRDGKFVVFHDDDTKRLSDKNFVISDTDYETIKSLRLKSVKNHTSSDDYEIPDLKDYLSVCAQYDKTAVIELKQRIETKYIKEIYLETEKYHNVKNTIFISFSLENLLDLRRDFPDVNVQYLKENFNDDVLNILKKYKMDLDLGYWVCSKEVIDICHANNIKVNVWTVDNPGDAERLIDYGVDYITSNILE